MLKVFTQYYPERNIFFILGESLMIHLAIICANWLLQGNAAFTIWLAPRILLITLVCQTSLYLFNLYDLKVTNTLTELLIRLLQALGVAAIVMAFIYMIFPEVIFKEGMFVVSIGFVIAFVVLWRLMYYRILDSDFFNQKVMILGSGKFARVIINEINDRKDCGYKIGCIVCESPSHLFLGEKLNVHAVCQEDKVIFDTAGKLNIKKVIDALDERRNGLFPTEELLQCRFRGVEVISGISFYERLSGKLTVNHITPGWLIFSDGFKRSSRIIFLKRLFDVTLSAFMLITLLPLIIATAVLIRMESKGPIFFSQERMAKNRKIFKIHKFRSMTVDAEKDGVPRWAKVKDNRVTGVGTFIRKWRIDEIPQLWNVLKGEMSFVGPRPEREYFVKMLENDYKIPYYGERFLVKPGVTGWAQIKYPYGASREDALEKTKYDLFYIKNMSIMMDLMIVFRTVKTVVTGSGAR